MLHIFGRYFFPDIIKGDYETPEIHIDLITFLSSPDNGAGIMPRGFAKSTWEKIDTIHDIVYALEPVIVYYSSIFQDAQFHFESIKGELENNEKLRVVYGNLVPDLRDVFSSKWTNKHFQTTNGVNCIARGAGKGRGINIKNQRPTKIIIDDGETDEMVRSTHRREKYAHWVLNVVIPSLDKMAGRLKIIGTVIHPHAFVKKFYDDHGGIFRRAIENEESVWPQMWPVSDLLRLRDGFTDKDGKIHAGIGIRAFSQEYMNEPINEETSIFKQEWLDANTYGTMPTEKELESRFEVKMSVDPNAGLSQMADFMAIVVIARDRITNKRWVLHAEKYKYPIKLKDPSKPSQVSVFDSIYKSFNPVIASVEKVLNQTALYQILLGENKYRLKAFTPAGKDKVNRAQMVAPLVAQGVILFNPKHKDLYSEMIEFPNGEHDDLCLAGDTLILTKLGEIPINTVTRGMEVMTRQGWKRVIESGQTGFTETITNIGIRGTWNHPVIVGDGTKPLAYVTADDIIHVWNPITSSIEAKPTGDTHSADAGNYAFTFGNTIKTTLHRLRCTDRNGLTNTGLFQRDMSFITLMGIRLTMIYRILSASVHARILRCICWSLNKSHDLVSLLKPHRFTQKSGMDQKPVVTGTNNTEKKLGKNENLPQNDVLFVKENSAPCGQHERKYVQKNAGTEKKQPVYNLKVDGAHEFFANRVLVHNCDAFFQCNSLFEANVVSFKQEKQSMITGGLINKKF